MTKMALRMLSLTVSAVFASAVAVGAPGPTTAYAAPSAADARCFTYVTLNSHYGYCVQTGGARYRAYTECQGRNGPYNAYGTWVREPNWTVATCLNNERRTGRKDWMQWECEVVCFARDEAVPSLPD